MKLTLSSLAAATLLAAAVQMPAQAVGTAHPEELNDAISTATPSTKPSPAITAAQEETPLPAPKPDAPVADTKPEPMLHAREASPSVAPPVHDYNLPVPGQLSLEHHAEAAPVVSEDINSGIVTVVPSKPNELPEGTLLRARLDHAIVTGVTAQGETFTARLVADVSRQGKVLIPSGSIVTGRITEIRKGKRIGTAAMIRLQPDSITLPDGARFEFNAQLIDLDHYQDSHVTTEGAVLANEHTKAKVAALTLTTGSAVAAGAVLGGAPGAVIGAGVGLTAGAIWWLKQDHQQTLPEGTGLILSLNQPLMLVPEAPTLAANGN